MDCFNHLCPFRQNTTSNCNRCECLACQNREKEFVTYIASNQTLTADEIARMTNNPDYGVGGGVLGGGVTERLTKRDNFFAVSKNEDFYSQRTEAMTPP